MQPTPAVPLALLGGTFDPVHYGHLQLAAELAESLAPIEVRLVPARDPPHRRTPTAGAADRLAMLELAVAPYPSLAVDACELAREGKSYTVLTLEGLRAEAPQRPLALIMGADALLGLPTWHRWHDVLKLAHLIVVERPGVSLAIEALPPHLRLEWERRLRPDASILRLAPGGAIVVEPVTPQPISATAIRAALCRGATDEVRGLLPPAVLAYIESHHLYEPTTGCAVIP